MHHRGCPSFAAALCQHRWPCNALMLRQAAQTAKQPDKLSRSQLLWHGMLMLVAIRQSWQVSHGFAIRGAEAAPAAGAPQSLDVQDEAAAEGSPIMLENADDAIVIEAEPGPELDDVQVRQSFLGCEQMLRVRTNMPHAPWLI